jgi:hypothetical protein
VRGLEGTCVTWIDPITHQPVPLSITQTPATLPAAQSRVDFYATVTLNTITQLPNELKKQVQAVVRDAYYTKLKFVARVVDEGQLLFALKMRKDANLKHLFTGPRTGKPGRPRKSVCMTLLAGTRCPGPMNACCTPWSRTQSA